MDKRISSGIGGFVCAALMGANTNILLVTPLGVSHLGRSRLQSSVREEKEVFSPGEQGSGDTLHRRGDLQVALGTLGLFLQKGSLRQVGKEFFGVDGRLKEQVDPFHIGMTCSASSKVKFRPMVQPAGQFQNVSVL
jgi:hypothetical protein